MYRPKGGTDHAIKPAFRLADTCVSLTGHNCHPPVSCEAGLTNAPASRFLRRLVQLLSFFAADSRQHATSSQWRPRVSPLVASAQFRSSSETETSACSRHYGIIFVDCQTSTAWSLDQWANWLYSSTPREDSDPGQLQRPRPRENILASILSLLSSGKRFAAGKGMT